MFAIPMGHGTARQIIQIACAGKDIYDISDISDSYSYGSKAP